MRGRTGLAGLLMLSVLGLFLGLGYMAWSAMQDLPGRSSLTQASAEASEPITAEVRARRRAEREAQAVLDGEAEDEEGVRYVDGNGIVAARVDGRLVRAPSTVEIEPPPPQEPARQTYRLVVIEEAGLIDARSHRIALAHVEPPGLDQRCVNGAGVRWPCGMRARTALRRFVRRRPIACLDLNTTQRGDEPVTVALCEVAGTDLSRWLIEQGWAAPKDTAPQEWRTAHATAKNFGLGMFDRNAR